MKKRLLIFTVILTLLCGTLVAYQALGDSRRGGTVTISREEYDRLAQYAKLDEVLQYIQAYYYQEPDTDAMMDMAVQGLLAGLEDTYTFYYDTESWSDLWSEEEGEYTGIGIQLLGDEGQFVFAIPNGHLIRPAALQLRGGGLPALQPLIHQGKQRLSPGKLLGKHPLALPERSDFSVQFAAVQRGQHIALFHLVTYADQERVVIISRFPEAVAFLPGGEVFYPYAFGQGDIPLPNGGKAVFRGRAFLYHKDLLRPARFSGAAACQQCKHRQRARGDA